MKTCVLITTYNRAEQLKKSLSRMEKLTLPDEILVVDDGSSDSTEAVVREVEGRLPIRYIYNHNPNWSICSFARNIGVKNTDSDLIITSEPEMLWVTDIVPIVKEEMKKYPNQLISASIIYKAQQGTKWNPGLISDPVAALKDYTVEDYQIEPRSYHPEGFCKTKGLQATYIGAYMKDWIMDVGGWDEGFPGCWGFDDIDLATRLRVNGINQHICDRMEAVHLWHEAPPQEVWMKDAHENDVYFTNKKIEDATSPYLVANKDKEWGVIKTR